jgi:chromate transporter
VNIFLLYFLLLKATLTSFSGLASLPVVRNDFVVRYHLLSDRELNTAVAAGRLGPGPLGLYVVSVGYFAAGIPGACAGCLAMITPAFLIVPMVRFLGSRAQHPRVRSATRAVLLAGAGLLLASSVPLARDAVTGSLTLGIVISSLLLIAFTRIDTVWVMLAAALVGLISFQF